MNNRWSPLHLQSYSESIQNKNNTYRYNSIYYGNEGTSFSDVDRDVNITSVDYISNILPVFIRLWGNGTHVRTHDFPSVRLRTRDVTYPGSYSRWEC
jgi:hypothetical protein